MRLANQAALWPHLLLPRVQVLRPELADAVAEAALHQAVVHAQAVRDGNGRGAAVGGRALQRSRQGWQQQGGEPPLPSPARRVLSATAKACMLLLRSPQLAAYTLHHPPLFQLSSLALIALFLSMRTCPALASAQWPASAAAAAPPAGSAWPRGWDPSCLCPLCCLPVLSIGRGGRWPATCQQRRQQ